MPSVKSLAENQYYGHPRNVFWHILFEILGESFSTDYEDRRRLILNNNLALWDVLSMCERKGSLDSRIMNEEPNDIRGLVNQYKGIDVIVFNGKKAEALFKRHFGELLKKDEYTFMSMPSTSPAYTIGKMKKVERWRMLVDYLK
jgi:hypoxanthine-DNA glycosylase